MKVKEYNKLLKDIEKDKKDSLKQLFDATVYDLHYFASKYIKSREIINTFIVDFFIDIWNNTDKYKNIDNTSVDMFLKQKLYDFIERNL